MFNKKWGVNSPKAAEAAIMLDMLEHVKDSTATILEEELIVINNKKLLHNEINEKWEKSGQHVNNAGGTVTKIKELIEMASFEIKFRLITNHKNKEHQFNRDPIQCLMKECDNQDLKAIEKINSKSEESGMEKFGKNCIRTNDVMIDRPVREAVRIIDAMEREKKYFSKIILSIATSSTKKLGMCSQMYFQPQH